jgi:GTPase Era involved in 16S rRNA processing/predicted enzyme related to lactoylglutathione lyase
MTETIPEFAIVGHPNEGKSSVVSTLAEDDSVRISPVPGETIVCRRFPVVIDGREVIGFVDTPGFQNPARTLEWMRSYSGSDDAAIAEFRRTHLEDPDFRDDCELFAPISEGAGIIYVVDGSRPLRNVDRAEMEVLRLTGRPRLAVINCKEEDTRYLDEWRNEFRKSFNAVRVFNAHRATYVERIDLLESLKRIDQDWQPALETVIDAFSQDWQRRNERSAEIICRMLEEALTHRLSRNVSEDAEAARLKGELAMKYNQDLTRMEQKAHRQIRKLYKHNIFKIDLPAHSILHTDLFSEETWQLLGLTKKQLITAAGLSGVAAGAALDIAAHGLSFGVFTAIGGLAGAGWAAMGGAGKLARTRVAGMNLGGRQIRMGPVDNIQLLYILLDRAFIFYAHVINWAHGRRDYDAVRASDEDDRGGMTARWNESARRTGMRFFKGIRTGDDMKTEKARREMNRVLVATLEMISQSDSGNRNDRRSK